MPQNAGVLYILTYKCASRHSGVRFLDIGSSKSGPNMWCFAHFYLKMCFAPQRRPIFEHRSFQNCSEIVVFCSFCLANVLRATAACHFSTSERQKVARACGVLRILTWKCFAPQPRAIFEHRNFKNGSSIVVFCAFWLENALRATAACHFSTSELQKWLRQWGVLCILTCKCASRHSGVPFFSCLPEQLPPHPPL